jgi:hypothetical protein
MEEAVVVQAGEVIGHHLCLEAGPDVGIVDGQGGQGPEPDGQPELVLREHVAGAEAVQAQHPPSALSGPRGGRRLALPARPACRGCAAQVSLALTADGRIGFVKGFAQGSITLTFQRP